MNRYERILAFLALLLLIISAFAGIDEPVGKQDDMIRLHVIANSDSPEDQALKLKVRDQLLSSFGDIFQEALTIEEAREAVKANLKSIEEVAAAEIRSRGCSYPVQARMGIYPFPTRVYGYSVYPAGQYEALRVIIGEGRGANWWCVMFPPLCFVDFSSGIYETSEGNSLKEGESPQDEPDTIIYTFKAAELWNRFMDWIGDLFCMD